MVLLCAYTAGIPSIRPSRASDLAGRVPTLASSGVPSSHTGLQISMGFRPSSSLSVNRVCQQMGYLLTKVASHGPGYLGKVADHHQHSSTKSESRLLRDVSLSTGLSFTVLFVGPEYWCAEIGLWWERYRQSERAPAEEASHLSNIIHSHGSDPFRMSPASSCTILLHLAPSYIFLLHPVPSCFILHLPAPSCIFLLYPSSS